MPPPASLVSVIGAAQGDGAAAAAGDLGGLAGAVVDGAGVGDVAAAAVEVEGDARGAADRAAGGAEGAGAEAGEVDAVGGAVGRADGVEGERGAGGAGDVDRRAAGRARRWSVPAAGTDTVPAFESANAAVAPLVVVSARSPNVVVPVVLVMLTPPAPEPVTVMASNVLVPRLVPVAPPVASRPAAPLVVIEMLPVGAKVTVPALLSRTPVAPLVLTVRFGDGEACRWWRRARARAGSRRCRCR